MLGAATLIWVSALGGVAPSTARAEWVEVYKGMPGGPHYAWKNNSTGVVEVSKGVVSGEAWRDKVKASAAAQARIGATGQSPSATFGSRAATNATKVITAVENAGQTAKGVLTAEAVKSKFLPALSVLGKVANGASAAYLGWQIGSTLRNFFVDKKPPPPEEATPVSQVGIDFKDAGEIIACVGAKCAVMPAPGMLALFQTKSGAFSGAEGGMYRTFGCESPWELSNHDWKTIGGKTPIVTPPGGQLVVGPASDEGSGCKKQAGGWFIPLAAANLGLGDGFGTPTKTSTAPSAVSPAAAEEAAEAQLKDPVYDPANAPWAHDWSIGGLGTVGPGEALEVEVPEIKPGVKIPKYEEELVEAGLTPNSVVLPEYGIDPTRGPEEVVRAVPVPGTKVSAGSTVKVRYNPADAPEPAGAGGPTCSASLDPIDIAPLGVPLGDKFPFGIFGWVVATTGSWAAAVEPPVWELTLGNGIEWTIDFGVIDPFLDVVRIAILIVSCLGFLFFLAAAATKTESGISSE